MTHNAAEDRIDKNIVRQPINVGQCVLVTYENKQFPKVLEKFGLFYCWPRADDILPYLFDDITKALDPPHTVSAGGHYSFAALHH